MSLPLLEEQHHCLGKKQQLVGKLHSRVQVADPLGNLVALISHQIVWAFWTDLGYGY